MTDFRALCIELTDCLEKADWPLRYRYVFRQWVDIARAALADGPAVPDGREPASVTGQPSDEDLLETLDKATATFPPRDPEAEGLNVVEYALALELRKARAVLARWGNHFPDAKKMVSQPAPPTEGPTRDERITRAVLAALAQPEHEVAGPSDEELIKEAIAVGLAFQPQDEAPEVFLPFDAEEPLDEELVDFARAVLARWGNQPAPPADGEVAELVARLSAIRNDYGLRHSADCQRAADLLQHLSPPQPPAEGEVEELVTLLAIGTDCSGGARLSSNQCRRAAELLQQKPRLDYDRVQEIATEAQIRSAAQYLIKKQHCDGDLIPAIKYAIARWGNPVPQPVPVSERLPGPEDCDEKGSCWLWTADDVDGVGHWSYSHRDWAMEGDVTHWLPAHALPLPGQEVR